MEPVLPTLTICPPARNEPALRRGIVIFGDDPSTRESLARALESEQYEVVRATDCQQAIQQFAAHTTALVLVDLGTDLRVAADGANWLTWLNPEVPLVILISSSEFPELNGRSQLVAVLEKPTPIPTLLITMKHLLEQAKESRSRRLTTPLWQDMAGYGRI